MRIERYEESRATAWDDFVRKSKNGTFLFTRGYMEYHRDRFEDYSLLVVDDDGSLLALLPATRSETALSSHGGLTYGGLVTDDTMKVPKMLQVFEALLRFLQEQSFTSIVYKTVPHIYHRAPAEEDRYALFLCNARLIRCGVLAVVDKRHRLSFQERRTRGAKKARQNGLEVRESDDFRAYWQILEERLMSAFGTRPVHSIEEIEALRSQFPENIRLFCVFEGNGMLGGVVIYETECVARVQYVASNERSRRVGALDLLFSDLLADRYQSIPYFDFGTSDEQNGRSLNTGLIDQKEGYGARAVVHDHYELEISDNALAQLTEAVR